MNWLQALLFSGLVGSCLCQTRVKRIVGGAPADEPPQEDEEFAPPTTPASESRPLVFVTKNRRSAKLSGIRDEDGSYRYLGIRYAEPPTGRFRFQRPRRLKLKGNIDATKFGPPCTQPSPDNKGYIGSEDCLFLNVFTPPEGGAAEDKSPGLPVLVWVHGGNFRRGSAAQYDPKPLVSKGVIVVTVQYRLGSLGFLSIGRKELPGNVGLFDISTAMRWIRQYIRFFGGDPRRIISSGQGSGASCASMLALNKYAKSSIAGILAMSGSSISPFSVDKNEVRTAREVSAADGCALEDGLNFVRCMQQLSLEAILRGDNSIEDVRMKTVGFPKNLASLQGPGPAEEGAEDNRFLPYFIPEAPLMSMQTANISGIPLLTGVTKDETNGGIYGNFFKEISTKLLSPSFLQSGIFKDLLEANTGLYLNKTVNPQLRSLFLNSDYLQFFTLVLQSALSDFEKIIKHTTDAFFNLPAFVTSHLWSKQGNVFLYSFEHVPKKTFADIFLPGLSLVNKGINPLQSPKKAGHGDDLSSLFNIRSLFGLPLNTTMTDPIDKKVRDYFTTLVAEFARTGVPKLNGQQWTPFSLKDSNYMIIAETPKLAKNFRKCQMALWTGDTNLLSSPECNFIGAAGEIVKNTIGSAGTTLLSGVTTIEQEVSNSLKPLTDAVADPFNAIMNPFGFGGQTTKKPSTTTKKPAQTTKRSLGLFGNFGG